MQINDTMKAAPPDGREAAAVTGLWKALFGRCKPIADRDEDVMSVTYSAGAARRITWTLFVTQSLGSAALIANATVNPIVGAELSGADALAGLPGTLLLLGAAGAAQPAGHLMQRVGRRWGLALGFFVGLAGMIVGGVAIVAHSFALFLLGLLLIGAARGAVDQSRYAAADAQTPDRRARAISTVVFAGTIGAVAGPKLVGPAGNLLSGLGVTPLAGPMWSGALLFGLAGLLIVALLRPDPRDIARAIASLATTDHRPPTTDHRQGDEVTSDASRVTSDTAPGTRHPALDTPVRSIREILRLPAAQLALAAMVFGQVVMVLIMSVTSLHMHHHQHGLDDVGTVITAHTLGMFGLSVLTGPLADRFGRPLTIAIGALLLIGGSLLAPVSLMTAWLAVALFLVGLGWNLCYIAGSSLLSDILAPAERGPVQGANELVVNLTSAISSLGSGVVMAGLGYSALGLAGAGLALLPLALVGWQGLARSHMAASTEAYISRTE
jgi:MFS family permease